MKRKFFTLLAICFFIINFKAYPVYQQGKIITSESDTIACSIRFYQEGILLSDKKIVYRKNEEKFKIELKDIKAVLLDDKTYHVFPAYSYDESKLPNIDESKFYRIGEVIVKGKVELIQAYYIIMTGYTPSPYGGHSGGRISVGGSLSLVKNNEVKLISRSTFNRSVGIMFRDCEAIVNKMNDLKYSLENLIEIVTEGNKVCYE